MKPFDVLFIDATAYKPYDSLTLDNEPLGGTEASLIRLAEAFAQLGATVGIAIHNLEEVSVGNDVYYLPLSYLEQADTDVLISLRGTVGFNLFPKALKFSWQHDLPSEALARMRDAFITSSATVVGVSNWHKRELQRVLCHPDESINPHVTYVYNPVAAPYIHKDTEVKYDRNKLVWLSSPHKGLDKAISLFANARRNIPSLELCVYNPGYLAAGAISCEGVRYYGACSPREIWQACSESLCVFYPCQFDETFGLVAAEANNVHCPVLTYERAGLRESVATPDQFVPINDDKAFITKLMSWYNGDRPKVYGQARFQPLEVAQDWLKLIKQKKARGV